MFWTVLIDRLTHNLFYVLQTWRVLYGMVRIAAGVALLHVVHVPLADVLRDFGRAHLLAVPGHELLRPLLHLVSEHQIEVTYFLAAYLLFWGVMDMVLALLVLTHVHWAFPPSMVLIVLFAMYELIRGVSHGSLLLVGLGFLDLGIVYLTYREYERLRVRPPATAAL